MQKCKKLLYCISNTESAVETALYAGERVSGLDRQANFTTTHWSLVMAAGETSSPGATAALEELCRAYWYPLYAYVRRKGHNPEDAQDLVQDFFARFLAHRFVRLADPNRGRFRTFLLHSLKHFLISEWTKTQRAKRGGGQVVLSLDDDSAEARFASEPATEQPPDALFDRGWAAVLLQRAMEKLAREFEESGKQELFDRLKVCVWGGENAKSYAEMAAELGISEGSLKVAVHRLRHRFGELLRNEIAQTVATPAEVSQELRYLISVIRNAPEVVGNSPGKTE